MVIKAILLLVIGQCAGGTCRSYVPTYMPDHTSASVLVPSYSQLTVVPSVAHIPSDARYVGTRNGSHFYVRQPQPQVRRAPPEHYKTSELYKLWRD